jgi:hypothetical protein
MVVLAIVAGVWMLVDRGKVTDRERQDRGHDVFPAYRRGDIDGFELVQGASRVAISRRPDPGDGGDFHWHMTAPVDERADPAAVDRFIGDLEFAGAIRKVDPSAAPDIGRGFDPPRMRGTLSMKPLVYHFALGGPAPIPEGAAYFRVDGEGTFVVSKDFVASLMNGPDAYRERTVVPYLSLDLASLEVRGPAGGFTVQRADDLTFKLAGDGLRASREGLDKVWGALAEARAESFLQDADADHALGPSPVRVLMTPKDAKKPRGELLLGGVCPGHPEDVVLVRLSPVRASACVPKGALPGLLTPADALVDRHLFTARADEVEEITLETVPAGFTVELARQARGWHERKPSDRELSGTEIDTMNDLVTRLTRGDATLVEADDAKAPFVARARARIKRGGSGAEEVVELGPGNDRVRRAFDGARLVVPPELGRRLWPSEIAFRGRTVFPDGLAGTTPASVVTRCEGVRQSLAYEGGRWTMREPGGYAADPLATADVVTLVRNAQAESWVADRDDGSFGLGDGACKIEVDGAGDAGAPAIGILFGKEAEGGAFYARTLSDRAVFLAPRALREGAVTWLLDRGVFRADPRSVDRITLSRGAARAVFVGRHEALDGGADDTTSRLLGSLEALRPETVIHPGPPRPAEGFGTPTLDVRVKTVADAGSRELHFVLGDTALVNRERVVYARVDGVDATYGIARDRLGALLGAL